MGKKKTKKVSSEDVADLAEPFIDEASKELLLRFAGQEMTELAGDIPIAKSVLVVGKLFNSARNYHRTKMLIAFLKSLQNGEKSFEEFESLTEDEKNEMRGLVVAQLDLHTDERQAEATGLIVDSYLQNKIDRLTFIGLLSEIKNTNPLLYYFNVDAIGITKNDKGGAETKGPTSLLPSAFGHNTVQGIGQWGSTGDYKYVVTPLGIAFFDHVYNPMYDKYSV